MKISIVKIIPGFLLLSCIHIAISAQQIIPLYNGQKPPGAELFNLPEKQDMTDEGELYQVSNVSMPTITVVRPEKGKENGTAVIVCPGGAFLFLGYTPEGMDIAKWLVSKGVTAFVLKYRLTPLSDETLKILERDRARGYFGSVDSLIAPYVPFAVADGREAVKYVRKHASEFNIEPDRIGMMGFSAGGALVASVAMTYDKESRPDFVAPIYAFCQAMIGDKVPDDAPPMFMAMAADDPISYCNTAFYEKWRDAGKIVEMHIYQDGGHGHAIDIQNKALDNWPLVFEDWLMTNGYMLTPKASKTIPPRELINIKRNIFEKVFSDWSSTGRYKNDNIAAGMPAKGEKRVVFMGNSITDWWLTTDSLFFHDEPYINRGIAGQQTDQMLVRFRPDVIALAPSVVIILAGTNDIQAEKPLEQILGNIISMVELAKMNDIIPVLCLVTPVLEYPISPGINAVAKVSELNKMIKEYSVNNNLIYVDYYSAMVDKSGGMKQELTSDGIHPNFAGYRVIELLVESAIKEAIK